MAIEKALLLKGLGVCAICAGGTTVALKWGDISNALFSPSESKKKMVWGGLECEEPTEQEGGECSIKTGDKAGKIFVKKKEGSSHFELLNLEGGGKIKVYKVQKTEGEDGYKDGFKFLIEEGDIGTENNKLEEFETYEIKKGTDSNEADLKDQYFLSQKSDSKTEIKKALGLPWDLPDSDPKEQTNITNENVGAIKFKGGPASLSEGSVTLKITKETDKKQYPLGYKFTFKNTSETAATLKNGSETISIKKTSPIDFDFKIKRNGSSLSLEKAWSIETFAPKVGLVKDGDYWDVGQEGLNVKVNDSNKKTKKTKKAGSTGKIKVYEGQAEYDGGFKFTIENDDLILEDSGSPDITLGQFQSYEIVKDGENLYLFKKEEAKEGIKKALGLPWELPDSSDDHANITNNDLKTIKFKGGTASISGGTVTLTITKDTTGNDYPLGYKFSFKNTADSDATLTYGGETITLRQNSPVEFKIKKEGSSISLEKAWTLEELTKKVGLKKDGEEYWFVGDSGMNVKLDESTKKTEKVKYGTPTGRIKVYSDQKGYNEGFKFTIEKGDIDLKEEKDNSSSQTINLGQFQSFEIVKDTGVWYLSKKVGDQSRIKELLGLANSNCEFPTEAATPKECPLTSQNIGSAKFEGAGAGNVTVTGSPKLTIHKESGRYSYPLGYRFTFTSSSGNSSISIPASSGSPTSISLKKGVDIDYKIKVSETNSENLTLEKAWTADALIGETGIKKDGSDAWSLQSGMIQIKHDSNKKSTEATASGNQKAKIRVYEGSPGYNQGYKFVVEEGDTSLTDGGGISQISKYETYEVVKDSDNTWYFTRKLSFPESMREILGLPEKCKMPTTTDCELNLSELNEIKFEGKGASSVTVTEGSSITLKITKESNSYPQGYKFTFSSSNEHGFTIPLTTGNLEVKNNSNNEFKIKENGGKSTLEVVGS